MHPFGIKSWGAKLSEYVGTSNDKNKIDFLLCFRFRVYVQL